MTSPAQQAIFDAAKVRFATMGEDRIESGGKVFIRNLAKICPFCRDVFWGYQVEGQEVEPYRIDPDPIDGNGTRETCGHPLCHDAEDDYQFQRRRGFRQQQAKAREHAQAGPVHRKEAM